uniref:(northern house mosquito) hypothetical protein n=1 Tax=Culex pipiens TaxID=7175 RepID=A0A8D8N9G2_CULPI
MTNLPDDLRLLRMILVRFFQPPRDPTLQPTPRRRTHSRQLDNVLRCLPKLQQFFSARWMSFLAFQFLLYARFFFSSHRSAGISSIYSSSGRSVGHFEGSAAGTRLAI